MVKTEFVFPHRKSGYTTRKHSALYEICSMNTSSKTPGAVLWQFHLPPETSKFLDSQCFGRGWRQDICEQLIESLVKELQSLGMTSGFTPEHRDLLDNTLSSAWTKSKPKTKPKSNVKS